MGPNIACNGPTMTFSPFWLGSESIPYDPESYSRGMNYGGQLNFMVPLDNSITEQCKSITNCLTESDFKKAKRMGLITRIIVLIVG